MLLKNFNYEIIEIATSIENENKYLVQKNGVQACADAKHSAFIGKIYYEAQAQCLDSKKVGKDKILKRGSVKDFVTLPDKRILRSL